MSNTDSFIDEVTEEVRRDRLFKIMRRYGWIAILAVVILVGGAAMNEYRKAVDKKNAEALGGAILAALEEDDSAARIAALATIEGSPEAQVIVTLLTAAENVTAGNKSEALALLDQVITNSATQQMYRDLAVFKKVLLQGTEVASSERRAMLETLTAAGGAFRLLAEEQIALIDVEEGNKGAAVTALRAILDDAETTAGLRRRASQLIVALGGESGAT